MGSSYQIRLASASPTALNSTIDASTPSRRNLSTTQRGNGVIRGTTRRRHAANQLLMLQPPHLSQPEVRGAASKTGAGAVGAKKLAQHRPSSNSSAKKLAPRARKRRFWAILSAQGELFRAHAHIRPRRANFFAHEARQRGDVETNNTSAHPQQGSLETGIASALPQQGTLETDITSAPEKRTKNAHFPPAKAIAVSIGARPAPAKAMTVSVEARPAPAKAMPVSTPHSHT